MVLGLGVDTSSPINSVVDSAKSAASLVNAINPFADHASISGGANLIGTNTTDLTPTSGGYIDPFFNWQANDALNFRSIFGYQFVITNGGQYVNHIYLPIAPQSISMSVPVASNVAVTMKGITEDNNAAPLRPITITGTSGMWHTTAPSGNANSATSNVLNYVFRNTIQAVNTVASQASKLASVFDGSAPLNDGPLNYPTINPATDLPSSGYYFFHNLVRFLDFYVTNKKTRAGKDLRLTFQMHKDEMYYDVLLNNYSWKKNPGTLEYEYSIGMTAYRRRANPVLNDPSDGSPSNTVQQVSSLNALASVINSLTQAQNLISAAAGVIRGINADANAILFAPLKQLILLGSSLLGLATTIAQFPQAIVNSAKQSIVSAIQNVTGSANQLRSQIDSTMQQFGLRGAQAVTGSSAISTQAAIQATDGLSQSAGRPETASPYELIFQDVVYYAPVFALIQTSSLSLPATVQASIDAYTAQVLATTIPQWQQMRDNIKLLEVQVSQAFGGGSATYNRFLNIPPPPTTFRQLTVDDIVLLNNINDIQIGFDNVISILQNLQPSTTTDYYSFYQDFAVANGLVFDQSASKFFVPFPYDGTLESLAVQYLGDANRWIEIASLNGLREPYVDESGFTRAITSDAAVSSVEVSDISDYYIGEVVMVQSSTKPAVPQQIRSMTEISVGQFLIDFEEGGSSLIGYRVDDNASILAYAPDTVNSRKLIAIPSQNPVNIPGTIKLTPDYADLNGLGVLAKVDLLLQSDGQMVMNGNDFGLATGMTNLVQAATLRFQTPIGALLNDPTYGNPLQAGISVATVDVTEYLKTMNRQFQRDTRFKGVLAGTVSVNGPAAVVNMLLGVSGTQLNLPLSTQVPF